MEFVDILLDFGYSATESVAALKSILTHAKIQRMSEASIADVLVSIVTHLKNHVPKVPGAQNINSWNPAVLAAVFIESNPVLNPALVVKHLDRDFIINDPDAFDFIYKFFTFKDNLFPSLYFLGSWKHKNTQFSILKLAISSEHSTKIFGNLFNSRKVIPSGDNYRALAHFGNSMWNCLDLVERLVELGKEKELQQHVLNILVSASQSNPEILLIAFSKLSWNNNSFYQDLLNNLIVIFIQGHANSSLILPVVWQTSPSLVVLGCLYFYNSEPSALSRILDLTQEIKILPQVLETKPFNFAIDLAALASRREYLNLEKWLQDHIREEGTGFLLACLEFLREKISAKLVRQENSSVPLSIDVAAIFLKTLFSHKEFIPQEKALLFREVFNSCVQAYPQLETLIPPMESGSQQSQPPSFSHDIEEEANSYYERIYKGELSIPQIVEILSRFKSSSSSRETQIFKCMIHNLFDEYQFFPRYPDKELAITSVLFGSLIQNQIISAMALGLALRYILEALRQPIGSKLYNFASQAMFQFQGRLLEWPQYCTLLVQIPHLHQSMPEIIQKITRSLKLSDVKTETPSESTTAVDFLQNQQIVPLFSALKLENELDSSNNTPNEEILDKILFVVNNISFDNISAKVTEISQNLSVDHFKWFSNYIVKRASLEPNFHDLYSALLDSLCKKELDKHILNETMLCISNLLNSEKTVSSSQERTLLKNLGTWLGVLTLAKNRPVKHKNLSFKDLLLEGYDSSRLIVVIPFVSKVLEQCHASRVFAPPNPWLMAIMKLMAELYHFANLKLNLKFEIEVLCKKLKLDIKDIPTTDILRNRPLKDYPSKLPEADSSVSATADSNVPVFSNIAAFINFNPNIPIFNTQPSLKRIVHIAIDRGIREVVVSPVVERSVSIASMAARELVVKDFALEGNEDKMRKAAHLMVQSLAGSLAAVSTREPLRVSMIEHLKNLLAQNGFTEQSVPEQIVYIIISDNLDLACSVMEKTAAEKSVADIDEFLAAAYMNRRKHRERTSQPFYDMAVFGASRYPSLLPESLKLKPNGLTVSQMKVYEDFVRISRSGSPQMETERATRPQRTEAREAPGYYGNNPEPVYENKTPTVLTTQQALEKFASLMIELERNIQQNLNATLSSLYANHIVRALIRQVPLLVTQASNRDDCALLFSQKIVQSLYKNDNKLSREINLLILERLCELSKRFFKELKEWLLYNNDERKYNVPITVSLLERGFMSVQELDMQMARLIDSGSGSAITFTCNLIQICLLSDPPLCSYNAFLLSNEALSRLPAEGIVSTTYVLAFYLKISVISVNKGINAKMSVLLEHEISSSSDDLSKCKEQIISVYKEWIQVYGHPASNERNQLNYIAMLQENKILSANNLSLIYFRIAIEATMDAYSQSSTLGVSNTSTYQTVDALARLFVLLIVYQPDQPGSVPHSGKQKLMKQIFSVISLVLAHSHEQNHTAFNQKPFFRLLSSMLYGFHSYESNLEPVHAQLLVCISNTLHSLNPTVLPGFTFSWIQLISHRFLMPKLLLEKNRKYWILFQRLLVDLFSFLNPYLTQSVLSNTSRILYKATLRLLLVLLHDFPEFLCDYHFSLVDVIPHTCVQLRNLILSAFPQNMRLPDPFTPNLKVDLLPEINQSPNILSDYTESMRANDLLTEIDVYLETRGPASFLANLQTKLMKKVSNVGKYDIGAINSLVLHVGIVAISQTQNKSSQTTAPITHSAPMDIFQQLVVDLDNEGRYYLFNAIANQLRYPNSHTHYFSCVLLYLFSEASQEKIQEQITRVLIERLIVNRPHPYGLLITFIELIRNPRYNFWELNIIRCAPEIERLFSNVAKSIISRVQQ